MDKLSMDLEFAKNLDDEELSKKYSIDNDETEITEETPSSQNTALKTINGNGSDQYSQVAALAKKLHEEEKKKYEERKRRRAEQEKTERKVKRKITEEEEKLKIQETNTSKANSTLYQLFNDLQGVSNDFDLKIESPELVVVGMQSDGKSSFIEALLSFQFNIVESSIGTRRPLIIQMINDQSKKEPYCRFRKEESVVGKSNDSNPKNNGSFSSSLSSSTSSTNGMEDCFETDPVPVHKLSDELNRRTNDVAGFSTDCVSSKPIILRVEYYACANLTIFDTPGFRLRGDEKLKSEIEEMVMEIIKPSHRIIICLEQSTVEWANTNSRHIVSRVDPNFERTILVNTKFDNRVKELRNSNSANKYLSGENLPIGKKPFFISLPVKRELSPESFSEHIKKCYLEDYKCLLSVNFDESIHLDNLGFFRLKTFLEKSLTENYHKSIVPTLQSLETLVRKTSNEIDNIKKELKTNTIENLKSKVNLFVQNFLLITEKLLEGSIIGSPDTYGQTLQEEKNLSNVQPWPNSQINYEIENNDHKLYGGAQFNRILNEFEYAAHSIEFPPTSINEVASSIGNSKGHNMPSFDSAASDIVQFKSKKVLLPLIEIVCQRTTYIMKRLFSISIEVMKSGDDQFNEGNCSILSSYDLFVSDLQNTFYTFIESIEKNCKKKLIEDFATFTKIVDWDLLTGLQSFKETSLVNSTPEQTKERVINLMKPQNLLNEQKDNPIFLRTRNIDQNSYKYICEISAKLFSGIRFFFVKYIRNKLNAFFLEPIFQKLGTYLSEHFRKMENSTYEKMFDLGIKDLENKLVVLQKKYTHCKLNRDKFKEICSKIKNYN